jgi:hypothetical protein
MPIIDDRLNPEAREIRSDEEAKALRDKFGAARGKLIKAGA